VTEQSIVPQKYAPYPDKKSIIYRWGLTDPNLN
jgi:hypothetical protein